MANHNGGRNIDRSIIRPILRLKCRPYFAILEFHGSYC